MILTFPRMLQANVRRQIAARRREILDGKIKLRQMCRVFETGDEKEARRALERCRAIDAALKPWLKNQRRLK